MSHSDRQGAALPHFNGIHRFLAGAVPLVVIACVTGRGTSTEKLTHEEHLAESVRLMEQGSAYFHIGDSVTFGLVKRRSRVTENALRRAHHLPLRGAFDPAEAE